MCSSEGYIPPFITSHLDPVPARLVFTGVSRFSRGADLLSFNGNEISGARCLPSPHPTKDIMELVLLNGEQRIEGVKIIQIEAEAIHWDIPL